MKSLNTKIRVIVVMAAVMCAMLLASAPAFASFADWTEATSSAGWAGRGNFAGLVYNNEMWIMGGNTSPSLNDVWSSSDGVNWTQATAAAGWAGRYGFGAAVFLDKMWVMGGNGGKPSWPVLTDVWSSSDGANWTEETSNPGWSPRQIHSPLVYADKMWVLGGANNSDVWSSSDGANWTQVTTSTGWGNRWNHGALVFQDKMWLLGGGSGGVVKNDVWYSTDGINWTEATASAGWSPREVNAAGNGGAIVYDGKMWVMGGYNNAGSYLGDIWSSEDGVNWTEEASSTDWGTRGAFPALAYNNKMWIMGGNGSTNDVWYAPGLSTERIEIGINTTLELNYTQEELDQLTQLYLDGKNALNPDPIIINGLTWSYVDSDLPKQDEYTLGEAYFTGGKWYVYLGSGLEGASEVPAGAALLSALILIVSIRFRKSRLIRHSA